MLNRFYGRRNGLAIDRFKLVALADSGTVRGPAPHDDPRCYALRGFNPGHAIVGNLILPPLLVIQDSKPHQNQTQKSKQSVVSRKDGILVILKSVSGR